MKHTIKLILLCCLLIGWGGCEKDTEPTWIAPDMTLETVAQSTINRKEATLTGTIGDNKLDITECGFLYSTNKTLLEQKATTDKDVHICPVSNKSGKCTVELTELTPGTDYFYCLYVTCGTTTVISKDILQFKTTPNDAPTLDAVTIVERTNQSVSLSGSIVSIGAERIELRGFCYALGKDADPTLNDKMITVPSGQELFQSEINDLEASTEYSVRAFAMNNAGSVGYGPKSNVTTDNSDKPTVRTNEEPDVRGSYAIATAEILNPGNTPVLTKGFCWSSTNLNPIIETAESYIEVASDKTIFSGEITNLKESTTYYIRSFASNLAGISYGNKITISTITVREGTVTIAKPFNIGTITAQLLGTVVDNGNGSITERGFCWSSSNQTPTIGGSGCTNHAIEGEKFEWVLDKLTSNLTYYVVAYAINEKGTSYSAVENFKTLVLAEPTLATPSITTPTTNSAYASSSVISINNSDVIEKGFCWSASNNKPTLEDSSIKVTTDNFTAQLTGLEFGKTYFVQAYAKNAVGIGYSSAASFTTTSIIQPSIEMNAPSNMTTTTAQLLATIVNNGNGTIKTKGFCWSSSNQNPTVNGSECGSHVVEGDNFAAVLSKLAPNTRYYVTAYAENEKGVGYSTVHSFLTQLLAEPTLAAPSISKETVNSAHASSSIMATNNSDIIEKGFCWSTSNKTPTIADEKSIVTDANFEATLSNLTHSSTYYVRAFAKNGVGVGYSDVSTFKTIVISAPKSNITSSEHTTSTAKITVEIADKGNGNISRQGFCYGTSANPTIENGAVHEYEDFEKDIHETVLTKLSDGETYHVRAFAVNEKGIGYSSDHAFTTGGIALPTLNAVTSTGITTTTAQLVATIVNNGNGKVISKGFCWSSSNQNPTIKGSECSSHAVVGENLGVVLSNLTPNTRYYVTAYAENEKGVGYSAVHSFVTLILAEPTLAAPAISKETVKSAYASSSIIATNNSDVIEKGFCWSTSNKTPTIADEKIMVTDVNFEIMLPNLMHSSTHYVRAFAKNAVGVGYSPVSTFKTTTISVPQSKVTSNEYSTSSAKVTVEITNKGNGSISRQGFCYSTSANPTIENGTIHEYEDFGKDIHETVLTKLSHGVTYHVRSFAVNEKGIGYSSDHTFTTGSISLPTLSYSVTTSETTINSTKASASISSHGNGTISEKGFCWCEADVSNAPTIGAANVLSKAVTDGGDSFSYIIPNLTPGKNYNVRAYAKNEKGIAYNSSTREFTTLSVSVPSFSYSGTTTESIGFNEIRIKATIEDEGNRTITAKGFYWSTVNTLPDGKDGKQLITGSNQTMTYTLSGLKENTKYYIRAFATNQEGTTMTSTLTVTTKINPIPDGGDMPSPGN